MEEKKKEETWKEVLCLEEKLILLLPPNWTRMSKEGIDRLFPYKVQPKEIFGLEEEKKVFTLQLLSKPLGEDQVYAAVKEIRRVIEKKYPESSRLFIKRKKLKAGEAGWFSFVTGREEKEEVHYMFILSFNGELLLGSYHFPEREEGEELSVFHQLLKEMKKAEE